MTQGLFSKVSWHDVARFAQSQVDPRVLQLNENEILNTPIEDLVARISGDLSINIPVLLVGEAVADQQEVPITVYDPYSRNRSQTRTVPGTQVSLTIPFSGDKECFDYQPSICEHPPNFVRLVEPYVVMSVAGQDLTPAQVRKELDGAVNVVIEQLDRLRAHAEPVNHQTPQLVREAIERRRKKLLADRNLVAELGYPLRPRPDAPKTFVAPEIRRKIVTHPTSAPTAPFRPEPTLAPEDYENILTIIENMSTPAASTAVGVLYAAHLYAARAS